MMAERPRWEPWQAMLCAFCAGIVFASLVIVGAVWLLYLAVPQ
jgi:hypothetical protein